MKVRNKFCERVQTSVRFTNGVTLIELLITLSLLGVIILIASTMLIFSNRSQSVISKEFQIHSDMRVASEILNREIRYSSAIFLINENQFRDSRDVVNEWNYIAVSDERDEIIHYVWDESIGKHKPISLVKSSDGMLYGLDFHGVSSNSRLVNFTLSGYTKGSAQPKVSVSTTLNAINAAVVDDSSTMMAPSHTIAYRTDDIPDPDKINVAITLVLDTSGSMADKMGGTGPGKDEIRMPIMKEKAKELIDLFSEMSNVYISLIPFNTNANNPWPFVKAETNLVDLKNRVDGYVANGGTNAGDGLRRSYFRHQDFNNSQSDQVLNYTILLMDGNPTFWPSQNGSSHYYGTDDISSTFSVLGGNGSTTIEGSMNYIKEFSNRFILKNDHTQKVFMKTFVIGFTGIPEEVERAEEIATYHTHISDNRIKGMYYSATSSEELKEVFASIADYILHETWHIYGPLQ